MVHAAAAERIVGYEILGTLGGGGQVFAATDDSGQRLLGGAVVEEVVAADLAERDPDRAKLLTQMHRVLAGLFVVQEAEGETIGRELVEVAAKSALGDGARYLDGFVDDRNDSAGFYRATGAHLLPRNAPLPARSPANVTQVTPGGDLSGHWFYWDLWKYLEGDIQCAHCASTLSYSPVEDRLACPQCRPAPDVHDGTG